MSQLTLPDLSLYIHIPWCIKKCPYCDFNSHQSNIDAIPKDEYIQQLFKDLDNNLVYVQGRQLKSIFIGGGTPSLFSPNNIETILNGVNHRIPFCDDIEITMEANPGSVENIYLNDFSQAGVNRLSLGVQSFNDIHLKKLGRIHDSHLAKTAIEKSSKAGFKNINIDLMHGLPDQTIEQAMEDIDQALTFETNHLSWYQLTLEPNTVFYSSPPSLPSENLLDSIYDIGHERLLKSGFERYEISAYAKKKSFSKHNLNYWKFGDYLGIGAGAHGKITLINQQKIIRTQKTRLPKDYLSAVFNSENNKIVCVNKEERSLEFFMNTLRISEGFTIQEFIQKTDQNFDHWMKKFILLAEKDLIIINGEHIRTTPLGAQFLNSILNSLNE